MDNLNDHDPITVIEFCAGYGGLGLGIKGVLGERMRLIGLCELEGFAQANLISKMEAGLMAQVPIWSNLLTFPYRKFRGLVDIAAAGIPCQPHSLAGKRSGGGDERFLFDDWLCGLEQMQPRAIFIENVEGFLSSKMPDGTLCVEWTIKRLESMGYKVSWGIFSAREVGAPHQRKRVFILAHRIDKGSQGRKGEHGHVGCGSAGVLNKWPSRPGQPQYGWEPPRVVANSASQRANAGHQLCDEECGQGRALPLQSDDSGEGMGNADCFDRRTSASGWIDDTETGSAGEIVGESEEQGCGRLDDESGEVGGRETRGHADWSSNPEQQEQWQAESALGECFDESSSILDETLTLNPYGDNVYGYENLSKKRRAREILFDVWTSASSEAIQWTIGGLQYFLAEKILQSGMQLDGFTQRICYFVWCVQTGHKAQGWGLSGMSVYESCGSSSQGQKPLEQFKRELGYAMCQLSYEIALEGEQDFVEAKSIMHGVRESSERAWVLSQALPEMEEVWRSTLDQKVWEKGCYIEATSIGNRTDELRLLGNGVVPATATLAFKTLLAELLNTQGSL